MEPRPHTHRAVFGDEPVFPQWAFLFTDVDTFAVVYALALISGGHATMSSDDEEVALECIRQDIRTASRIVDEPTVTWTLASCMMFRDGAKKVPVGQLGAACCWKTPLAS